MGHIPTHAIFFLRQAWKHSVECGVHLMPESIIGESCICSHTPMSAYSCPGLLCWHKSCIYWYIYLCFENDLILISSIPLKALKLKNRISSGTTGET